MATPRSTLLASVLAAGVIAGCGSSTAPSDSADRTAARPAPRQVGPMIVTGTDARIGDATAATARGGIQELATGPRRVDPTVLRERDLREGVAGETTCPDIDLIPSTENLPTVAASTLCLLNAERAATGLPALTLNEKLAQASLAHSQDMVANGYFAHQSQDGRTVADRARAAGYIPADREWIVGENLAWGTGTLASPQKTMSAWMNSEGHRANILRREFNEIGFGIVVGTPGNGTAGATYTTVFGSVAGAQPATSDADVASTVATDAVTRAVRRRTCRKTRVRRSRAARARCARLARRARAARNR